MSKIQAFIQTASLGRMELTERSDSFRFGSLQPGGWWQASINILSPERDLWALVDADEAGTLEFYIDGALLWRGDLAGFDLSQNKLSISAEGPAMGMKGREIWQAFADSEYRRWKAADTDRFDRDNNNRLYMASRANIEFGEGEEARLYWPEAAVYDGRVQRVTAHVECAAWGRDWTIGLRGDAVEAWTFDFGGNPTGTANMHIIAVENRGALDSEYIEIVNTGSLEKTITGFTLWSGTTLIYTVPTFTMPAGKSIKIHSAAGVNTATELYMALSAAAFAEASGLAQLNNDSGSVRCTYHWLDIDVEMDAGVIEFFLATQQDGYANAFAKITQACVRTLDPSTNDAIISTVLAANGIAEADVRGTGLTLDQAVYEGANGVDVIKAMAFLGDGAESWVCVVYGDGAELRPWATAPDWLLTRADLDTWSISRDRVNVHNAVRAKLPDGWISAWFEDADSITRYGRREKTLPLPQTSQAEAERMAQIYLSERANILNSLRIEAGRLIRKPDNSLWPAALVRAGDVMVLRDLIPQQDVTIRVAEAQANGGPRGATMQIVPLGASSRLEVLLAKLKIT